MSADNLDKGSKDDLPDGWVGDPDDIPEMEPVLPISTAQVLNEYGAYIKEIGGVQNAQRGDMDNVLMALHLASTDEAQTEQGNQSV